MKRLYAPWRAKYIAKESKECPFCIQQAQDLEKHFILKKFDHCFVMLNLYPYNAGHILIVPYNHKAKLNNLSCEERSALMEATSISTQILEQVLKPDGLNIGLNLGKTAGGSIPEHLHMHCLPRWESDTNFLVTLDNTKTISFDLHNMYAQLKIAFDKLDA